MSGDFKVNHNFGSITHIFVWENRQLPAFSTSALVDTDCSMEHGKRSFLTLGYFIYESSFNKTLR